MYMMCELKYNDKMREAFEKGYAEGFSEGEIKGVIETCKFFILTKKVEDYIEKFW